MSAAGSDRNHRKAHPSKSKKRVPASTPAVTDAAAAKTGGAGRPVLRSVPVLVAVAVVVFGLLVAVGAKLVLSRRTLASTVPGTTPQVLAPGAAAAELRALQAPGLAMTERLARFAAWSEQQPLGDWTQSVQRAAYLQSQSPPLEDTARIAYEIDLANSLLSAGDNVGAVHRLEALLAGGGLGPATDAATDARARKLLSMAYLRMGEQANCVNARSAESCLLPIQGRGVHLDKTGSRKAVEVLLAMLTDYPDNLVARWLLNIATMTLGGYPDQVPAKWLIPPTAFDSEYPLPRFHDVSAAAGVGVMGHAGGGIAEDFDNDGDLDLMASSMGLRDPLRFFRNDGDGHFTDVSDAAGLAGQLGGLNIVQTDYNNDGWLDVFVPRGAWRQTFGELPSSLLRNNGDGTFTDVTEASGLLNFSPTQVAVWADYDADGWLDLFIGNEGRTDGAYRSRLYHNNGDGTFADVSEAAGLDLAAFVKGASWGDYDNDGRPDLYLSVLGADNHLFHNEGRQANGAWSFRDVTAEARVGGPTDSFSTWFWDFDNDGWLDIFVADYRLVQAGRATMIAASYLGQLPDGYGPTLYHNERDGSFSNASLSTGLVRPTLTMGSNFGDFDNDGFPDLYLATGDPELETLVPNLAYRNDGGRHFQDVTSAAGLGHIQKGHGVAFGDVDNDGDQDIFVVMGGAYPADLAARLLFENPGNNNHWVRLQLVGGPSNRPAIGARVKFTVDTPRGPREYHAVVGTGSSFGANSLWLEQGLGDASALRSVEIVWPSGGPAQGISGVGMDAAWRVQEGEGAAQSVTLRAMKLPR